MKKLILQIVFLALLSSCKKDEYLCTCKNWAKAGKLMEERKVEAHSDCTFLEMQYQGVYPGEVRCTFSKK